MSLFEAFRPHHLLLRLTFFLLISFLSASSGHAAEVTLAWDPNTDPNVSGYRVYYGTVTRSYNQFVPVGNYTSCVVAGLDQSQTYYFSATAVNSAGTESDFSNEVSVALSSPTTSQTPLSNAGQDQNVNEGGTVTLSAGTSDPGLTYLWKQVSGTSVVLSTPTAPQTTFTTPDVKSGGEWLAFTLTVTDSNGQTSSDTCQVYVQWVNEPPLANAGPDQNVNEGATVTLSGANSSDPDGEALTYAWQQVSGTPVVLSDPTASQATFKTSDVTADGETLVFQLTVTDPQGLPSSDSCLVNVLWVNQPPVANAGPDQQIMEGKQVTLNGSGSGDPEGLALQYEWVQTSGTTVVLSNRFAAQPTFIAPNVGPEGVTLMFQLTVTDSGGLQARDSCIANVVWVNQPPTANAGPDQNVDQGASVTLDGTRSTDPDGGSLAYYWLQTGGSPVTLDNPASAQPRFATITGGSQDTLVFKLTVTDPGGLSGSDQCWVVANSAASGVDLAGQWLSLSRSVKRNSSSVTGKIRVRNLGGTAAPSSEIKFYESTSPDVTAGVYLGKASVSSVPAGGYVDLKINLKCTSTPSVYYVAVLDASNATTETDEGNNLVLSGLVR